MRRVLIVDESEVFATIISDACFAQDEVRICGDGNAALTQLHQFRPDLLLLNLSLPFKDGLAVLREAAYLPKRLMAISYLSNPYILRSLGALGVQYVLHLPTAGGINQALAVINEQKPAVRSDLRSSVTEHLQRLRIPTNLDGYRMLVVGLPLYMSDISQQLGKELYPAIVYALGQGTEQTVERSIRQAIKSAWSQRDDGVWAQYFQPNSRGVIRCPSTKQFLTVLARRLEAELSE